MERPQISTKCYQPKKSGLCNTDKNEASTIDFNNQQLPGSKNIRQDVKTIFRTASHSSMNSDVSCASSIATFDVSLAEVSLRSVGEAKEIIDRFPVEMSLPIHPTITSSDICEEARDFSDLTSPMKIFQICREKIPHWTRLQETDIIIGQLMIGLSNQLFKVHVKEEISNKEFFPITKVLFRIYGKDVGLIYDSDIELRIFKYLSGVGVAPRLIAEFEGGRIEEWLEGGSLPLEDMGKSSVIVSVAAIIANIHKLEPPKFIDNTPCIDKYLSRWRENAMEIYVSITPDHPQYDAFQRLDLPKLHEESFHLSKYLFPDGVPECEVARPTFCHNDIQENNIMIHRNVMRLIDFEYSGLNFPAYDIASFFWEMTCDYTKESCPYFEIDPSKYPPLEKRELFCAMYLTNLTGKIVKKDCKEQINTNLDAVERFLLACHMLWGFWSVIRVPQAATTTSFDMLYYGQQRGAEKNFAGELLLYFQHPKMSVAARSRTKPFKNMAVDDQVMLDASQPHTQEHSAISESTRAAIDAIDIKTAVSVIKKGAFLMKYCRNAFQKPHQRLFWVDMESLVLRWQSPKKSGARTSLFLTDVQRIVPGVDSDFWRSKSQSEQQLGIELLSPGRRLRLLCSNSDEWKTWLKGLIHAHQKAIAKRKRVGSITNDYIQKQWALADLDKNGSLSFYELIHLLQRINFCADVRYAEQLFEQYDEDGSCVLELDAFKLLFHKLLTHQDLLQYFDRYQEKKTELVTEAGFKRFLNEVQGTPAHLLADEAAYISTLEEPFKQDKALTNLGFNVLLTSEFNTIVDPAKKKVNVQDMKHPITQYWISTSHNTYLTADQMVGKSAVGQYIDALLGGCRCVELDCWDGNDGEPVIYHGYTLTSKISFAAVLKACHDYGFEVQRNFFVKHEHDTSPYPVILSLEMHCSPKQKKRAGELIASILGPKLYRHPIGAPVPSPYDLRHKFIIKGKIPDEHGNEIDEGNEQDFLMSEEELQLKLSSADPESIYKLITASTITSPPRLDESKVQAPLRKSSSLKSLSSEKKNDLQIYYSTVSLTGRKFDMTDTNRKGMDICSLNDKRFTKLARLKAKELVEFHQKFLSRVYPSGTRIMSSNYNPMPCWIHGAQLVALNYQAFGLATLLNLGRFMENGNAGYVLKPLILRNSSQIFDSSNITKNYLDLVKEPEISLTIQILAAQQLPRPIIDEKINRRRDALCPFVVVSLHGVKEDTVTKKTHHVPNNGLNPRWKDQKFTFNVLVSSCAILVFEVRHYDSVRSTFIAGSAVPVSAIRSGIRWVELYDAKLRLIPWSGLLVHVSTKLTKQTSLYLDPSTPSKFMNIPKQIPQTPSVLLADKAALLKSK